RPRGVLVERPRGEEEDRRLAAGLGRGDVGVADAVALAAVLGPDQQGTLALEGVELIVVKVLIQPGAIVRAGRPGGDHGHLLEGRIAAAQLRRQGALAGRAHAREDDATPAHVSPLKCDAVIIVQGRGTTERPEEKETERVRKRAFRPGAGGDPD